MQSLTVEDFVRILTEPKSSLVKQSTALLETEGLKLEFTKDALEEIATFAFRVNESTENIGARRLHTIMERVLDEISFVAPELMKAPAATSESQPDQPPKPQILAPAHGHDLPITERNTPSGGKEKVAIIDAEYVRKMVASIVKDQDLSRYIL